VQLPLFNQRKRNALPETQLIQTLKNVLRSYRILPVLLQTSGGSWCGLRSFAGKVSANFDLRSGRGYESLLPIPTAALWRTWNKARRAETFRRLPAVLLSRHATDRSAGKDFGGFSDHSAKRSARDIHGGVRTRDGTLSTVYEGEDGWIYKVGRALPRAFLVPRVVAAPDGPESLRM
jgi:hypothetical protein